MSIEQLPLFGLPTELPLSAAISGFHKHMVRKGFTENTISAFLNDLRILTRYLGDNRPLSQIGTSELKDFMTYLRYERGVPCKPKSYSRRMTTLKVFFAWLTELGVLAKDPAAPLVHKPVQVPLPRILYDDQVEQVLAVTRQMMAGQGPAGKPDPRPHLLVTLLLHTGIKKQECMGIKLAHIDSSNPARPVVHIRYENPRMQYKERRLGLRAGWTQTLAHYRRAYEPQESLFPCTPRNLEYVLTNVAKQAGLPDGLSFEMLRWTCAVRDYQGRIEPDRLRRKLGLSRMSWKETEPKIIRLAEPPL